MTPLTVTAPPPAPAQLSRLRPPGLRLKGDESLARLASQGHEGAFTALYERHAQALYRYCLSIVGHPEDARDALQSAMLCVLRALEERPPTQEVRPWLYRIAHNESVTILRRRRPHEGLEDLDAPAATDLHVDLDTRERLGGLLGDLRRLPERQRGALLMRELSGLGYSEIAEAFGVTPQAARQSVFEARVALHELADGREADCDAIRRTLSDGDHRTLRARRVRGHLHACDQCRQFHRGLSARRARLALVPALPVSGVGAVLQTVLGASATSVGGLAAAGAGAGAVAGSAGSLVGSVAFKSLAAGAAAAVAGLGGLQAELHGSSHPARRHGAVARHAPPGAPASLLPRDVAAAAGPARPRAERSRAAQAGPARHHAQAAAPARSAAASAIHAQGAHRAFHAHKPAGRRQQTAPVTPAPPPAPAPAPPPPAKSAAPVSQSLQQAHDAMLAAWAAAQQQLRQAVQDAGTQLTGSLTSSLGSLDATLSRLRSTQPGGVDVQLSWPFR